MNHRDAEGTERETKSKLPLAGKRVVVTRARKQAGALAGLLRDRGAEVIEFPAIEIAPPADWQPLDNALRQLDQYRWLVLTSVNGVEMVWQRLADLDLTERRWPHLRIAAIGPATAEALAVQGVVADFVPHEYVAEAIASGLPDVRGVRILLARADLARRDLAVALRDRGAVVDEVVVYRTLSAQVDRATLNRLQSAPVDILTFASSSTVRNFVQALGADQAQALAARAIVACIGPITARTARDLGLKVDVMPEVYTIPALVEALVGARET